MKKNILSLAVLAALSTTLVACGGSSNGNTSYTTPTPTTPNPITPSPSPTPTTPEASTSLELTSLNITDSAITGTLVNNKNTALAGQKATLTIPGLTAPVEVTTDDKGNFKADLTAEQVAAVKKDTGKVTVSATVSGSTTALTGGGQINGVGTTDTPPPANNTPGNQLPGNNATANAELSKPTVLGQQYLRAEGSNFDRVPPTDKTPGTNIKSDDNSIGTLKSNTTLQDKKLQNIVLGSEENNRDGAKVKTARYAGKIDNTDPTNVKYTEDGARRVIDKDNKTLTLKDLKLADKEERLQDVNESRVVSNVSFAVDLSKAADYDKAGLFYKFYTGKTNHLEVADSRKTITIDGNADDKKARIFGAKYDDASVTDTTLANSYHAKAVITAAGTGYKATDYVATQRLDNVQYGRVSNNIDPLLTEDANEAPYYVAAPYAARNDDKAVNTYFYRGLNETTIAQMDSIKAANKDQVLTYYGHALTYGINDGSNKSAADLNSNSPGADKFINTVGDFVVANYDVAKNTVSGNIYNVKFEADTVAGLANAKGVNNNLVSFTGEVRGNTATGTSTNLVANQTGTFQSSFFGTDASEIGGAVNSVANNSYGVGKWGAVFGAKRDVKVQQQNPVGDNTVTPE